MFVNKGKKRGQGGYVARTPARILAKGRASLPTPAKRW
jgi:hypothetical protein